MESIPLHDKVGEEIAKHGAILVTGGLGGIMEAASKGAKNMEGLVVGIIPHDNSAKANSFNDVIISTGLGHSRNFVTAYSADAIIVIGGGIGTLIETGVAYLKSKPIIAIIESGGVADKVVNTYLDDRCLVKILGEKDPCIAVKKALSLMT